MDQRQRNKKNTQDPNFFPGDLEQTWILRERFEEVKLLLERLEKFQSELRQKFPDSNRVLISAEDQIFIQKHCREISKIWGDWKVEKEVVRNWPPGRKKIFFQQWGTVSFSIDWLFKKEFEIMKLRPWDPFRQSYFNILEFKTVVDHLVECLVKGTYLSDSVFSENYYLVMKMLEEFKLSD